MLNKKKVEVTESSIEEEVGRKNEGSEEENEENDDQDLISVD